MAQKKATAFGTALAQKFNTMAGTNPNANEKTAAVPTPPAPTGGITISKELLPDVTVGDTVTLRVDNIDETTGEISLSQV